MLHVAVRKELSEFVLNIEFTVADSILVLFGPSGCGKTTTLRCIAGLTVPDAGRITLNDRPLYAADSKVFLPPRDRGVGYMFQNYALFPHLTVRKNILYGVKKSRESTGRLFDELLSLLKIDRLIERFPGGLSGGEQQRVALARALMAEPEVLLLDEPLSALDQDIRIELQDELLRIQRLWKIPFVLVTHDREEAEKLGSQIIFLEKGREMRK